MEPPQPPAVRDDQPAERVYRGRPENQRDPRARNVRGQPRPQLPRQQPAAQQRQAPPPLNRPTKAATNQKAEQTTSRGNPAEGSVFATGLTVVETQLRRTFTPSTPAAIEISRLTYAEMLTDDTQLNKALLPEYLDYYTTAMLWLRIIHLKQSNSQPLTPAEQDILLLVQATSFCVPEPILLQVMQLGSIVTDIKQHLYPEFPPLPEEVVANFPGYYGAIQLPGPNVEDNSTHNLYEEIPCLGVTAEAVRQTVSDAAPGRYQSNLDINDNNRVNGNLLGYKPLSLRRPEAKNLAFSHGINNAAFPAYPENTAFNFDFIAAISNVLATTKTFKNTDVVFSTMTAVGAQSQTVISRPIVQLGRINILGDTRTTSLSQNPPSTYGSAVFFDSQLIKTPGVNNNHGTWCCVDVQGGTPNVWVNNRNARRDLPIHYMQEVFQSISLDGMTYRQAIVKQLVTTKR